jgi:tellurite resistance protein TehA-like permease
MAVRHRTPPALTDIGGNWYLWAVGTQSLAIAATFLWAVGILGARPAALLAIVAWLAGVALTAAAVGFWILASSLIPLLLGRAAWRHLLRREPVRYRADLWMIVFPCGMYATASMQLGTAARLPLVHAVGTAAAWAAVFVWALTFAAMIVWLATRRLLV